LSYFSHLHFSLAFGSVFLPFREREKERERERERERVGWKLKRILTRIFFLCRHSEAINNFFLLLSFFKRKKKETKCKEGALEKLLINVTCGIKQKKKRQSVFSPKHLFSLFYYILAHLPILKKEKKKLSWNSYLMEILSGMLSIEKLINQTVQNHP
jgi:hypothetical protein